MGLLKKSALAIALSGAAMSASASQFYIDTGGIAGVGGTPYDSSVCATCTGLMTQANVAYNSTTIITPNNPGGLTVGDGITTTGGLNDGTPGTIDLGNFPTNKVDGFNPGTNSARFTADQTVIADGFDVHGDGSVIVTEYWGLSFTMDLVGNIAQLGAGNVVEEISYSSGLIEVFAIVDDADDVAGDADGSDIIDAINIFDMTVTGSSFDNSGNFEVNGLISFGTGVAEDSAFYDFFNIDPATGGTCAGQNSFKDIADCVPAMEVTWVLDQNLDNIAAGSNPSGDGTFILKADHNGSMSFNVPEPGSLLLIGAGLLGFAGRMRRKNA